MINASDTAHYFHQDALQSVVVVTDGFRNKSATYEYDVYGGIREKIGSYDNEILFTGRWLDEDTGLYYYRARWYNAEHGRFVSRDPIRVEGGINIYGYVKANPITNSDPSGELTVGEVLAVGFVISISAIYKCLDAIKRFNACCEAIPSPKPCKSDGTLDENYDAKFEMWRDRCVNHCWQKSGVTKHCPGAAGAY